MKVEKLATELRGDLRKLSDRMDINFSYLTKRVQYLEKLLEKYHGLELEAET